MNFTPPRYTGPAIAAHWVIAALILVAFPLGVYMHELPLSPTKLKLYSYHKWIGITVLLLFVPRILWRITHRPPAPLPMPAWQHRIAEGTHHLLYLLMFLVPLSGWLMSSRWCTSVCCPCPTWWARAKTWATCSRKCMKPSTSACWRWLACTWPVPSST